MAKEPPFLWSTRLAQFVRGTIDGLAGRFQIDTGSSASLILNSPFVAAHDLRQRYHPVGNMVIGRGIGGYTRADLTRGNELRIGDFQLDDVVVDLSTDRRGAFASRRIDGNIGNDVLQRLTLTLDTSREVAYIEQNSRTAIPIPSNRGGLYVQNDDRRFFDVVSVLAGGPAYKAGLRVGDRIVAVDGTAAADVSLNDFWQLLRGPPAETHDFTVERDGETKTVSLKLQEIV